VSSSNVEKKLGAGEEGKNLGARRRFAAAGIEIGVIEPLDISRQLTIFLLSGKESEEETGILWDLTEGDDSDRSRHYKGPPKKRVVD